MSTVLILNKSSECENCADRKKNAFCNLPSEEIIKIQNYISTRKKYKEKETIYSQGENIGTVFVVKSGCLLLYNVSENGRRQILKVALPGDLVGLGRINLRNSAYGVKAITEAELCVFSEDVFKHIIRNEPNIAQRILLILSNEVSYFQFRLLNNGQKSARASIASLIMELCTKVKNQLPNLVDSKTGFCYFPLNQEGLADSCGLTKVHVNRVLNAFKKEGLIESAHKRMRIVDKERLTRIGQFDENLFKPQQLAIH